VLTEAEPPRLLLVLWEAAGKPPDGMFYSKTALAPFHGILSQPNNKLTKPMNRCKRRLFRVEYRRLKQCQANTN
jgi:hypothetical protein